jgi:YcaO-like protein with predicted kinase domain
VSETTITRDRPPTGGTGLAAVAELYEAVLPPGTLGRLRADPLDRLEIPVVATDWEGTGPDPEPAFSAFGYGAEEGQAAVGGLGELAESVLLTARLRRQRPRRASRRELLAELGPRGVVDPVSLVLPAGADADTERILDWLPATRWSTGEQVLVPAEFVACRAADTPGGPPPGGWLTTPITNGLGAGDTVDRALSHALLELVQRDGNTVSFRALEQGVLIDTAGLQDPVTRALLDRLRSAGIEAQVRLASTEFAVVVHVTGLDDDPATPPLAATACGEGAHPDREVAIRKAVEEYASSRARKVFAHGPLAAVRALDARYLDRELSRPLPPQESRALATMTRWCSMSAAELTDLLLPTVLSTTRTISLDELPVAPGPDEIGDPAALCALMLDRLSAFDPLVAHVRAAGPDGREIHVVKVVAPGMEVETLSYLRIGERVLRRLLDRGSPLVGLGTPDTVDRLPVVLDAAATERIGGPAWLDRAEVDRTLGALYPLYREPTRHAVPRLLGER